jgi:magnesium chelatase family protein
MLASIATFALDGIDSREITVEVDMRRGLPAFSIVGLPDAGVREARERVRAAMLNSELEFPLQRLTANLAPAHVRKAGASFDLALAVALLATSGQIPRDGLETHALCGELSLSGAVRPVHGTLAIALGARRCGYARLVVPAANAPEAALVEDLEVVGVESLAELVDLLRGRVEPRPVTPLAPSTRSAAGDLADVRGQDDAKRALEIAAAGGHNLLMVGPPGAGKTMLARRLPSILPPPSFDEAVEITRVHSVAGLGSGRLASERPFRAPHHTISAPGLIGGGGTPRPGEVTLAHRGVLFLDEMAEFSRAALEGLRQPLESGEVEVMRGQTNMRFPAAVMLVGACNECPCGRAQPDCKCSDVERARYYRRLSGPLIDRIDLICTVESPRRADLVDAADAPPGEPSATIRARVVAARERQTARLAQTPALCNAQMDGPMTRARVPLPAEARALLRAADSPGDLSGRAHDRVLRLARTIADLDGREHVGTDDVAEALGYKLTLPELAAA